MAILLILVTFVSQVSASSVLSCQMAEMEMANTMDHSSHMMTEKDVEQHHSSQDDCCARGNNCFMSSCITLALPELLQTPDSLATSKAVEQRALLLVSQFPNSLFRPPISSLMG